MSLSHLRILVADLAPPVAFYRDVVGMKQLVDVPGVYAEFDTGGSRLAFYRADLMSEVLGHAAGTTAGDNLVLCLRVADVDAEAARLAARGARQVTKPHDQPTWMQRVAHFADPAGRTIELWSPLPRGG
jgi:predicted enzyme related to lactoylglutathione lyase